MKDQMILLVCRNPAEWQPFVDVLIGKFGYIVQAVEHVIDVTAMVRQQPVALVLAEEGGGVDGVKLLTELRVSNPNIVRVIVIDSTAAVSLAALERAAIYQYLRKPIDQTQLLLLIQHGLESQELARRYRLLAREFQVTANAQIFSKPIFPHSSALIRQFESLLYVSDSMACVCDTARKAAVTDLPVLIEGETGTGKELLARAIHAASNRSASPLMVQNCGGMPDEIVRSELFGHAAGAIAGAVSGRLGLFRAADGGTVFLDEISEISENFQIALLRFLQSGEVKPLGSDNVLISNVRIIAASNRPLAQMVASGKFRKDLYFRLKGFALEVPPLRDRPEDIYALAEHFLAKYTSGGNTRILGISASALDKLGRYDFPGNVRELETELRRMIALAGDGEYLSTRDMSDLILSATQNRVGRFSGGPVFEGATLREKVKNMERYYVQDALSRSRWNQSRAAGELGLSRVGLANKIKRYGLEASHNVTND